LACKGAKPFVLAASGLAFEAAIASRDGAARACCGQQRLLVKALEACCEESCEGIISFGIAAGLDPALRPGAVLVASAVLFQDQRFATDPVWSGALFERCRPAVRGALLGAERPVLKSAEKAGLFQQMGAQALDMESHLAARFAAERQLRFAVLRVVADPAERDVPEIVFRALQPDGGTNVRALIRGLLRQPSAVAPLLRLGWETHVARRSLMRARDCLGLGFGLLDLG